jgi:cytochrome c5
MRSTGWWHAAGLLLLGGVLSGCGQPQGAATGEAAQQPPAVSPSDQLLLASAKVALPPTGILAADLPDPQSAGAQVLQSYCATCHALPSPAMHAAVDWPGVVRRMWLRMGLLDSTYHVPVPDLGERIVLLDYLTANSLKVSHGSLPDAPGRDFFEKTCSQCHELPDPRQHSATDWPVVVRRMNQHMADILKKEITPTQVEDIVRYLGQVHS